MNRKESDFEDVSGVDAAIGALSMSDDGPEDLHPERRQKALYNTFYENMLPLMKHEFPGLRLSQYKERIFEAWKTSPENPRYQQRLAAAAERRVEKENL